MREDMENKLADKGWQSMRQMLDREMPAERKRRPFAWWWLGLLLLPLAIWGGQAMWPSEPAPVNVPVPAHEQRPGNRPVVQSTESQEHTPSQISTSSGETSRQMTGKGAENLTRNAAGLRVAQAPALGRNIGGFQLPATIVPDKMPETTTVETPGTNLVFTIDGLASAPVLSGIPAATLLLPTQAPGAVSPENGATLPPAPLADITPVDKPAAQTPRNRKWSYGVTAAASTEAFSSLNGLSAGLNTDWRFARKWGVRTSAMYTRYRPTTASQPVVAVEEVSYVNATGLYTGNASVLDPTYPTNVATEDLPEGYVYIPLRKLHQIEMPVSVWWEPVSRLRLYSGFAVGYTFLGQSTDENYLNNQILSLKSGVSQRRASRVASSELQPWQFQYQGGLGYRIASHLDLVASWRMPFSGFSFRQKADAAYVLPSQNADIFNNSGSSGTSNAKRFVLQATWTF